MFMVMDRVSNESLFRVFMLVSVQSNAVTLKKHIMPVKSILRVDKQRFARFRNATPTSSIQ